MPAEQCSITQIRVVWITHHRHLQMWRALALDLSFTCNAWWVIGHTPADVEGAMLIFDEAHNIEDVCREAASIEVDLDTMREVRHSQGCTLCCIL